MDRIDAPQALGETDPADPSDITVINGAPFDGLKPGLSEKIKQRQIAIATHYVAALRRTVRTNW